MHDEKHIFQLATELSLVEMKERNEEEMQLPHFTEISLQKSKSVAL
jgi:hypothetical protein